MNIVFDLGGVVFRWQPDVIIAGIFDDKPTQDLVRREIFEHADWLDLDRGTLALSDAIVRGASRTGLAEAVIERLLNAVPGSLTPIQETIELVSRLSGTSHRLFVLSNMHRASIAHLERHHDIWGMFHGVVISSRIKMIKPEPEIYRYLLEEFSLEPSETVFIDDTPQNLEAASGHGIRSIRFTDAAQCEEELMVAERNG